MNIWTEMSIEFANQRNYLDELYKVYPISPNLCREISRESCQAIENYFLTRNNVELVKELLKLDLFPIKDSYVPYLRKDKTAIERNPNTVNRIAGNLYSMGLDVIFDRCSEPKETNRQMGPMFKNWLKSGVLGCKICETEESFMQTTENAIFLASDAKMKEFAIKYLGYTRISKGLDLVAKFNNKYIIGETKFITDFGGHQNDQFDDAIATLVSPIKNCGKEVITIAIVDGVSYIKGKHKAYKYFLNNNEQVILSALVLREFLYSL
ncbi:MAG: restriction endonuclease [Clostridiales bacterium]|nr:restriction endonuclease [Clostridiales bacterium]